MTCCLKGIRSPFSAVTLYVAKLEFKIIIDAFMPASVECALKLHPKSRTTRRGKKFLITTHSRGIPCPINGPLRNPRSDSLFSTLLPLAFKSVLSATDYEDDVAATRASTRFALSDMSKQNGAATPSILRSDGALRGPVFLKTALKPKRDSFHYRSTPPAAQEMPACWKRSSKHLVAFSGQAAASIIVCAELRTDLKPRRCMSFGSFCC